MEDLDHALRQSEEALRVMPKEHPDSADLLEDIAALYSLRFLNTKALEDIDESISKYEQAIENTPKDHTALVSRLYSIGAAYYDKYEQTDSTKDLELSIQHTEEAIEMTPEDDQDYVDRLQDLGDRVYIRFQVLDDLADLDRAIQQFQQALEKTPHDHPHRVDRLQNIGSALNDRYIKRKRREDLKRSLQYLEEALEGTRQDSPSRASRLMEIGLGYLLKFEATKAVKDRDISSARSEEALAHPLATLRDQFYCSRHLLRLYVQAGDLPAAHKAASKALSLIPWLQLRSLEFLEMVDIVADFTELASDATAVALMLERSPYEAIQLLELGRGVIIASMYETRNDISQLQREQPGLATEYLKLRGEFNNPTASPDGRQRIEAPQKLEGILSQIRALPNFKHFMLALSEEELKTSAALGPIVTINVSKYRCDAIIIEKSGLRTLPLSRLRSKDIEAHERSLMSPHGINVETLTWLWDSLAEPVLEALGFTETPTGRWPHIWWIPTGVLVKFPIHAAGHYFYGSISTVLDRVISSYSLSVKLLIRSHRDRPQRLLAQQSGDLVLVALEETPRLNDLKYARQEINRIESLFSSSSCQLPIRKPRPYRQDVQSALTNCEIFHFAGHGHTSLMHPEESSLILKDGPLKLLELFKTELRRPFLAYLSACGTGRVKGYGQLDEGVHLIGGFQLAGFQHVIGTLWEVNDEICVDLAAIAYKWMLDEDLSDKSVSEGLHQATRELRHRWLLENDLRHAVVQQDTLNDVSTGSHENKGDARDIELCDDTPLSWAPFVHFGI